MSRYRKTLAYIFGAAGTWCFAALPDGRVTTMEWVALAVAVLGAAGVYQIPNTPPVGQPSDPKISEQGYTLLGLLILITAVVLGAIGCYLLIVGAAVSHTLSATGLILLIVGIVLAFIGRAVEGGGRPLL